MNGITFIKNFIDNPTELFNKLKKNVEWDERMSARKTASYGKAYNYSQISYPFQEFTAEHLCSARNATLNKPYRT